MPLLAILGLGTLLLQFTNLGEPLPGFLLELLSLFGCLLPLLIDLIIEFFQLFVPLLMLLGLLQLVLHSSKLLFLFFALRAEFIDGL